MMQERERNLAWPLARATREAAMQAFAKELAWKSVNVPTRQKCHTNLMFELCRCDDCDSHISFLTDYDSPEPNAVMAF
jgi:hypothetical protein